MRADTVKRAVRQPNTAKPLNQAAFLAWLSANGVLDRRCDELCSLVIAYAADGLKDIAYAREVAGCMYDVIGRCNDISFDTKAQADAYALLHFVDRYQRAGETFCHLLSQGLWPRLRGRFDCLDIGTGPGPMLFAFADVHRLMQEFLLGPGWTNQSDRSELRPDYVERSRGFREWLHHFTEFANIQTRVGRWDVPYHKGSFYDFKAISYNQHYFEYDYDNDGDEVRIPRLLRRRFSFIMACNFLTTATDVPKFAEEISESIRYLKNTGLFICMGAPASKLPYDRIYGLLRDTIHGTRCSNWRYLARCRKVRKSSKTLHRRLGTPCELRLRKYACDLMGLLRQAGVWELVPSKAQSYMQRAASDYSISWEVGVYRKQSCLRPPRARPTAEKVTC